MRARVGDIWRVEPTGENIIYEFKITHIDNKRNYFTFKVIRGNPINSWLPLLENNIYSNKCIVTRIKSVADTKLGKILYKEKQV